MRFVLMQEADVPGGSPPPASRYAEMVEEARHAEALGWHTYATSEQHFNRTLATGSAPESFLAFLAARTEKIRLRFASIVLLPFNHPLRIAERIATLDILSGGRIEIGTARSNNPTTLRTFGVKATDTRALWTESIDVIQKALAFDPFSHDGEHYEIPETRLNPRPVQTPYPPFYVSATSIDTHFNAGRRGIGVMTGNSLPGGWEYMRECAAAYQDGIANRTPETASPGGAITESRSALALIAHCAPTNDQAIDEAAELARRGLEEVADWFDALAKASDDYSSMAPLREVLENLDDLPFLINRSPYLTIGDPDFFIERCRQIAECGYDEIIVRIDGMGHELHMQAIELIGKHVIPAMASGE